MEKFPGNQPHQFGTPKDSRDVFQTSKDKHAEALAESLALKAGREVVLVKRSAHTASEVSVGAEMKGTLMKDVHIGEEIFFKEGGNTSLVKDIYRIEENRFCIQTETSVYELMRQANDGSIEAQKKLREIGQNIKQQPQSVQDIYQKDTDLFYTSVEMGNKNYVFTKLNDDRVMALVEDENNPGKWKTRIFRFSGSDHQWKAYPGKRPNGDIMKGDEDHPLHHYVQSAKLHKDIYKAINGLPKAEQSNDDKIRKYQPMKPKPDDSGGRYWEEFEFKEKYQTLKNKEWASYQEFCQWLLRVYEYFVMGDDHKRDHTLDGNLYKQIKALPLDEFRRMQEAFEKANAIPGNQAVLKEINTYQMTRHQDKSEVINLADVMKKEVGSLVEKYFKARFPQTMMPDFVLDKRIDTYDKNDINGGKKNDIHIEEYKVSSPEGDELIFAMAYDGKGRVYIDNIYDPRVGFNDYGIPTEIVQMGHLVYKPEDYEDQTRLIPEKYIKPADNDPYVDISALWENIPVIQAFKEALMRRGIL